MASAVWPWPLREVRHHLGMVKNIDEACAKMSDAVEKLRRLDALHLMIPAALVNAARVATDVNEFMKANQLSAEDKARIKAHIEPLRDEFDRVKAIAQAEMAKKRQLESKGTP